MDGGQWRFEVFADFHTFLVMDQGADWSDLPDAIVRPGVLEAGFVQGTGYVAVSTARDFVVPVVVRLDVDADPQAPALPVDRVNDGVLDVASGVVRIACVSDNGRTGGQLSVPPGRYLLTAIARGLDSISDDGIDGDDSYEVVLRPANLK